MNIVICFLQGRDYVFSPCGRAFTCLSAKHADKPLMTLCDGLVSTLEYLLYIVSDVVSPMVPMIKSLTISLIKCHANMPHFEEMSFLIK